MFLKSSFVLSVIAAASYTCQAQSQLAASQIMVSAINMDGIEANFMFAPLANNGGAQVWIEVKSGLTKKSAVSPTGGFEYHIHVKPVGPNNDCMATGGHLDPTNVGAAKCLAVKPDKCQEGDLSGKHGELKATESGAIPPQSYNDKYIQFSGETTTIAGRSVVIHNNGTRVACGNIYPFEQSSSPSTSTKGATSAPDGDIQSQHSGASGGQVVLTMAVAVAGTVFGALMAL
ncbi:hypothetical protein EC957_006223 [Mortierella hygrophila]|uniref:Superoxide dismutase copper/zinc binding domain-containing protein n=1 Tax=Mortierella hygrophila TaxID=979708 RepID=A0A9P6EYC0_9FUNG|nr:hypothetical protein EC957_006223 [Mortierella hygrophila]